MKTHRLGKVAGVMLCLILIALVAAGLPALLRENADIPGLTAEERVLLRIWAVDAPGGGQAWLKGQLKQFEKANPGVSTYLRTVSASDLTDPEAVLPDVVLYMPGNVAAPEALFTPLGGEAVSGGTLREELLRCGRWQGEQYGLPVCWGAWVLAIDSALEPGAAVTPAPTTLLGRPAATESAQATAEPAYPLDAVKTAECALQSPGGAALFTLSLLVTERPALPEDFSLLSSAEVYSAFRSRKAATAMLTTGQATAFAFLTSGGKGFPFRVMVAQEIITDQVWLASVTPQAPAEAALLLSYLTSPQAQEALSAQELHTVRTDLRLYAADTAARVEQSAAQSLTAINAYVPVQDVQSAAWRFFQGQASLWETLLPLL